ncbi:cytochrome d ubiquinol oxidase subunit II [Rhodobacteraceae bacterium HSP-20]|uniref:Cytochrome d ubiquinol oxidase subunit II n=2 Tax=Paragemmobacter amnigenus TaxID=2852097 RepID=A0ABS6IY65_9RHOB|nr:cytochrome d ubiquinol oxidase subunit II [Rhodobacter amnigenus]MBU9696461.1 cytochrome d ubiquinol oxidase subunit II [Rhodobacter amnigenus]MBV4387688.1 cytochrome d ubiquinol oxidase subunit II [Rhodobacter amnigenus]
MAMFDPVALPLIFAALMGVSILLYVVLDGFDLGVGLLFPFADEGERDRMVASIGPFWDANETWLVLAIGILLVAFPVAHGDILTALYLPVAVMLIGLILRGVAFEFRAKAPLGHKRPWDAAFWAGSLMTALAQGFMLGMYVMGLEWTWAKVAFALGTAGALAVAYSFIGAGWVILKTDGVLQRKAVGWARGGIWGMVLGMGAVSVATPLVSARIFDKWFRFPEIVALAPLPLMSGLLVALLWLALRRLPTANDSFAWFPFAGAVVLMVLGFFGMAYSFYPYIVPEKLTIWQAAAATESLAIILVGTLVVLPMILGYTVLAYVIFRGKATKLSYD